MIRRSPPAPFAAIAAACCFAALTACPSTDGTLDGGVDAGADGGDAGVIPDPPIITPNEQGWWRDDVFYEIFVRSFQDSSGTGDGIGDLAGVTSRLDYLNDGDAASTSDLGVDGIWLMPIFPAASYHGYDVTDYRTIGSQYGTLEDFDALVAAAHQRGIKVVLDLVINHTASTHPWFVSAREGASSPYRDFYLWRDTRPTDASWNRPFGDRGNTWYEANGSYFYAVYHAGMPDLNWTNPAVEAEFVDIMKFWLARGVDGFRVDAIRYLVESDGLLVDRPETHEVVQRLRHAVHQEYPQALFLAEAWGSSNIVPAYYGEGNEFNLAFSFEIADSIRNSVKNRTRSAVEQANNLASVRFVDRGFEAPFLSNHDQTRVKRDFHYNSATDSAQMARLGAAMLFAQPGTPFLYYGEELGMMGGTLARDEDKRTPFRWTADPPQYGFTASENSWYSTAGYSAPEETGVDVASQREVAGSLWTHYRDLIRLRGTQPALQTGATVTARPENGGENVFGLLRTGADGSRVLFVANLASTASGAFTVPVAGTPNVLLAEGLGTPPTLSGTSLSFPDLGARSFAFIRLE